MSIILKGIDLPKDANIVIGVANDENFKMYFSSTNAFQVIQIPKGHGDIVDKDELIIRHNMESDRGIIGYYEAINNDVNVLLKSEEE